MKKLFTILSLLCLTMVAQAQEVTTWDTAGDLVTFEDFVASAGTGKRYAFRMPSISKRGWCNFTAVSDANATDLSINDLFTLEVSKEDDGAFWLKRFNDGLFLNGTASSSSWVEEGNAEDGWLPTSLYLENRTPDASAFSDPEEEYPIEETEPYYISFDNIEGLHFNNGNFGFKGGRGGWSAYFAYGPLYVVTVNCVDGEGKKIAEPVHHFALDGATFSFNAPEVMGYTSEDPEKTVTVNGEDVAFEFTYSIAQSITYTLNVTGAPEGTKMTIFGDEVDITATEYVSEWGPVTANEVLVTFPEEFEESLTYKVTVEGNVITVKCFDARYPINFDRDQTYTRSDRKTTWVSLGEQKIEWEFGGVGVEPAYRDMTDQPMIVPAGATVTPAIGYEKQWMHGFLYIDLDNDGQFTVDNPEDQTNWSTEPNGELVSYKNIGSALETAKRTLPDVTMPTEPGRYRARFKVDWASTDPGGNTGDGDNPDSPANNNHIIANGGCIIDVMLVVGEGHTVTYQVKDENGEVLAEKTSEVVAGATISAVPSDMLLPDFYDYSEVTPVTVEGDMTITTTATLKENPIFKFTSDTTNPVWYTLTIRKDFHPTYQPDIEPNVALPQEDAGNENTLWAFIGSPYKGFQIINQGAGTGLVLGSGDLAEDSREGGDTYATLAEPGSQTYELWFPKSSTEYENGFFLFNADGYALNHRSNENLAYWTTGHDGGSTFNAIDPEVAYHNLIDQLKNKPWGTGLNEYTFVYQGEDHTADALDVIASMAPAEYSMENMAALKAALEDAEITLNMPKPNTFLRIKSVKQDSYVSSKTGIEVNPEIASGYANVYTTGAEADDPSTIFFYDGLTLLSYTTGLYSVGVEAAEAGSEGDDMTFEEATNGVGMYWIKSSSANYWFGGTPTLDKWSTPATNEATRFQLEEVTELPVKLEAGAKGLYYAVFSIPTDASAVSGATVNKVTVKDNKALYSAIEGGIPAETGVLLIGESENATVTIGQFNGEYVSSDLVPMVKAEIEIEGLFFDPNSTDPFGFYEPTEEMTPRGFTAYLSLDTAGTSPIELADDPDGIELLDAERPTQNGAVYNLQGQKVTKTQKGVYIINNKKVVVK